MRKLNVQVTQREVLHIQYHREPAPTLNKINHDKTPTISSVFSTLQSPDTIAMIRRITHIPDLENDPHLHL